MENLSRHMNAQAESIQLHRLLEHGQLLVKVSGEKDLEEAGFGLNVPWGNFGIHGTTEIYSIGWASSHGCIRMNNDEVAELYEIIPIGTKVTIVDGPYGAFGKGFRDLKSGMYGSDVKAIQEKLKNLGFFNRNAKWKIWRRN